jgi:hypothetical protein
VTDLQTFLAGAAPDTVVIRLSDAAVPDPAALEPYAEPVEGGQARILDGATGRRVFQRATGQDPMAFAQAAGDREDRVDPDLSGAVCPAGDGNGGHELRIVFAFAEAQHDAVDGPSAEGPVIHAYVQCGCGTRYSDRWVAEGS